MVWPKIDMDHMTTAKPAMNLSRTLFRLWLLVNLPWLLFCSYEIYSNQLAWKKGIKAAKAHIAVLETFRPLMVEKSISDARRAHEKASKNGLAVGAFDEAAARREALSRSLRWQAKTGQTSEIEQSYRSAYEAQDRRDAYLALAPQIPLGAMALFSVVSWMARGVKKLAGG